MRLSSKRWRERLGKRRAQAARAFESYRQRPSKPDEPSVFERAQAVLRPRAIRAQKIVERIWAWLKPHWNLVYWPAALALLIGFAWFYLPTSDDPDLTALRNFAFGLGALVALLIAAPLAAVRSYALNRQADVAERGHVTDRFTKAIDQLGSDALEVRLGAIYALERIAQDSARDHWPIMETLTAYVRERAPLRRDDDDLEEMKRALGDGSDDAPREGAASNPDERPRLATDIQAAMTVIGRRKAEQDPPESDPWVSKLTFSYCDLKGVNLERLGFSNFSFFRCDLTYANLSFGQFKRTVFDQCQFCQARFNFADFSEALLNGCNLKGADLGAANFKLSSLRNTNLDAQNAFNLKLTGASINDCSVSTGFAGANFENTKFCKVCFVTMDFHRCLLDRTKFSSCVLRQVRLKISLTSRTKWYNNPALAPRFDDLSVEDWIEVNGERLTSADLGDDPGRAVLDRLLAEPVADA